MKLSSLFVAGRLGACKALFRLVCAPEGRFFSMSENADSVDFVSTPEAGACTAVLFKAGAAVNEDKLALPIASLVLARELVRDVTLELAISSCCCCCGVMVLASAKGCNVLTVFCAASSCAVSAFRCCT